MAGSVAEPQIIADNERVRIVRYLLAPGASTGWHRHELDYVIVPYGVCRVLVRSATGTIEATMTEDAPYFRARGAEHDVANPTDAPITFLEIELKDRPEQGG